MLESRFINMDSYHLYTRIASNTNLVSITVWPPDGEAVAYSARVHGVNHVFLRYLNSPNPVQLTMRIAIFRHQDSRATGGPPVPNSRLDQNDSQCTVYEPPWDSQHLCLFTMFCCGNQGPLRSPIYACNCHSPERD